MAATQHLELVKLVLNSYGGKATVDQIQQVLVPDVIRDDWKKWWEAARRELKKDGHFQVPLKKTEPIIYQVKEVSLQDRLMEEFRAAKGLKARVARRQRAAQERARPDATKRLPPRKSSPRSMPKSPATSARSRRWRSKRFSPVTTCARWPGCRPAEGELTPQAIWAQDAEAGPAAGRAAGIQAPPRAGIIQGRQSRALARVRCAAL